MPPSFKKSCLSGPISRPQFCWSPDWTSAQCFHFEGRNYCGFQFSRKRRKYLHYLPQNGF